WAPQRMASRTRSAGDNFLSMRAMRRGEKFNLVSAAVCGLSAVVAPCLIRAFLYSRNAWRLCVIFWRMHRLQYRLRPSLRARHMPNSDNGSDSSHLGHLFNSTTLNSAVLVTPCAPLLRFRLRKLMKHFARRQTSRLHPWSFEPFMTKFGDEPGCEPE